MSNIFTKIILNPTSAAAVTQTFGLNSENSSLQIYCSNLQDGETATLQYQDAFDNNWYDLKILVNPTTSVTPTLTADSNYINIIDDWGIYRLNKSATASPVGIFVRQFQNYNK